MRILKCHLHVRGARKDAIHVIRSRGKDCCRGPGGWPLPAVWQPQTTTAVDGEKAASLMKLVAALDDDDDVQAVYSNFEVPDEIMDMLTAA